jgi:flagellar biogenesis protein FliO
MQVISQWLALVVEGPGAEAFPPLSSPEFPFWHYLIKILVILGAMLGMLMLAVYLAKRFMPRYQSDHRLIKVLATHYLAPKQALILVAVGQETFLLASSAGQLSIIPLAHPKGETVLPPGPPPPPSG